VDDEQLAVLAEALKLVSPSESSISMVADVEAAAGDPRGGGTEGRVRRAGTKCEGKIGILKNKPAAGNVEGGGGGARGGCVPDRAYNSVQCLAVLSC
jgi:hypothetical protein